MKIIKFLLLPWVRVVVGKKTFQDWEILNWQLGSLFKTKQASLMLNAAHTQDNLQEWHCFEERMFQMSNATTSSLPSS